MVACVNKEQSYAVLGLAFEHAFTKHPSYDLTESGKRLFTELDRLGYAVCRKQKTPETTKEQMVIPENDPRFVLFNDLYGTSKDNYISFKFDERKSTKWRLRFTNVVNGVMQHVFESVD